MFRYLIFLSATFLFLACGTPTKKTKNIIGPNPKETNNSIPKPPISENTTPKVIASTLPNGAVIGNYNGDLKPFYAKVDRVDIKNEITYISFEDNRFPQLLIPKTYGGTVSPLILDGFDRDLLLLTAKLKDENFNKYFLYVLRENQWKPVMNGFAIHKSHKPENLQVIRVNPENPNELLRYYSVFDIDKKSETGYKWLLLEESVPKMAW